MRLLRLVGKKVKQYVDRLDTPQIRLSASTPVDLISNVPFVGRLWEPIGDVVLMGNWAHTRINIKLQIVHDELLRLYMNYDRGLRHGDSVSATTYTSVCPTVQLEGILNWSQEIFCVRPTS